jgi:hypothetical protein
MRRLAGAESWWSRSGLHALVAATAGAGVAVLADGWAELAGFAVLAVGCALLVVIDLAVKRLPDGIVGPLYVALFASLAVTATLDGNLAGPARAAAAAVLALAGYFLLAFTSPDGIGLGDVKLAGVLTGFLGRLGWARDAVRDARSVQRDGGSGSSRLPPDNQAQRGPVRAGHDCRRRARRRLRSSRLGVVNGTPRGQAGTHTKGGGEGAVRRHEHGRVPGLPRIAPRPSVN